MHLVSYTVKTFFKQRALLKFSFCIGFGIAKSQTIIIEVPNPSFQEFHLSVADKATCKSVGALTMLLLMPHAPPHKPARRNTIRVAAGTENSVSYFTHIIKNCVCTLKRDKRPRRTEHRLCRAVICHPQSYLLWAFISMGHRYPLAQLIICSYRSTHGHAASVLYD